MVVEADRATIGLETSDAITQGADAASIFWLSFIDTFELWQPYVTDPHHTFPPVAMPSHTETPPQARNDPVREGLRDRLTLTKLSRTCFISVEKLQS